jgi:hypothetical protein
MSELEVLVPIVREIVLQNRKINIKPFKFMQFPLVGKLIQSIREKFDLDDVKMHEGEDGKLEFDIDFIKLISVCGDEVENLCIIGSGENAEFIENLDGDEGILLLLTIFEVNKDFFSQKILPTFKKFVDRLAMAKVAGAS